MLELIEEYLDDRDFPKGNGVDTYSVFGRVAFALDKAAQHRVQLTALRRGLAVSILFNVILLAVVLFTIGGN